MKQEKYICDVKGCSNESEHKQKDIQVIFDTEQTEGRSVKPYLDTVKIDICEKCLQTILKEGKYLHASGAMGHNEYYFKSNKE